MGSNTRKLITCVKCCKPNKKHAGFGLCIACYNAQPNRLEVGRKRALEWYHTKGQSTGKIRRRREYDKARRGSPEGKAYRNKLNQENYKNNPEFQHRAIDNANQRSGKMADVPGSHTSAEWEQRKLDCNNRCVYCDKQEPEIKLTRDHIFPVRLGSLSSDSIENILPACESCNSARLNEQLVSGLLAHFLYSP